MSDTSELHEGDLVNPGTSYCIAIAHIIYKSDLAGPGAISCFTFPFIGPLCAIGQSQDNLISLHQQHRSQEISSFSLFSSENGAENYLKMTKSHGVISLSLF